MGVIGLSSKVESMSLRELFLCSAKGEFPPPDGKLVTIPRPMGAVAAVVAFTNHLVVATSLSDRWVRDHLDSGDIFSATSPKFIADIEDELQQKADNLDLVLVAPTSTPREAPNPVPTDMSTNALMQAPTSDERDAQRYDERIAQQDAQLHPVDAAAHERVERANRYRQEVQVYADRDERGVVIVGRGLDGRREIAIELAEGERGRGAGVALAEASRSLIPAGEYGFAQIAPGNVASLRAFLAAGFKPIAAEVLFLEEPDS